MRKSGGDVGEVVSSVRKIIHSDVYAILFEKLYGYEVKILQESSGAVTLNNYNVTKGASQLLGIGTQGSITGKHADIVITDDIVNLSDRASAAERNRIKLLYNELQNIKNPGGRILNTGTPWHKDDAFTLMPSPQIWSCYETGMLSK